MTFSWARVLAPVPDDWLVESYLRAMRDRTVAGLITPNEIHSAWNDIRAEIRRKAQEAEGQKYLVDRSPTTDNARFFAAGLEASRRLRGIPTPAGELFDEADVQAALRAIAPMQDAKERARLEQMRTAPLEVREQYKRPGRDTLEKLTGVRPRP